MLPAKSFTHTLKIGFIAMFLILSGICVGQQKPVAKPDPIIKRIADSLQAMNKHMPVEKVYIHTDKLYYDIGDTIWFKAYVLDGAMQTPTTLSNILYVQMDDDSANLVDRVSIRIKDGIGSGYLPIRKTQYLEGQHTLRAYTAWMQNFWYDYTFNHHFYLSTPIQDIWLAKTKTSITRVDDKDQIKVSLLLNRADALLSPVALKDVEVRLYNKQREIFNDELRTGVDGSLEFTARLKEWIETKQLRVEVSSLEQKDNNKTIKIPLLISRTQKIDLQFLPEGGKLVAGLTSVVGFKAVGEDGKGVDVVGGVYDSKGFKVADFKALHQGMGTFEFTPKGDASFGKMTGAIDAKAKMQEAYTARITQPQGVTEEYKLPAVEPWGTVMHIDNPEKGDNLKVTIAGLKSLYTDSSLHIVATTAGELCYSQKLADGQTELSVPKSVFITGVGKITLFKGMTPLNERPVFIDHQDQLKIKVTPHKSVYNKRDSVSLAIEVTDKDGQPVEGNFSLTVNDNAQTRPDTLGDHNIAANLLLNGNLKNNGDWHTWEDFTKHVHLGQVEEPGYYLNRTEPIAWQALDNLMLTQAWADYSWQSVLFDKKREIWIEPQNTLDIKGKIIDPLTEKRVPASRLLIASQRPGFSKEIPIDKNGVFVIKDILKLDSGSFFLQALRPDGKKMLTGEAIVDRPLRGVLFPPTSRLPALPWYVDSDSSAINSAKRRMAQAVANMPQGPGTNLKEVKIKSTKIIQGSWNKFGKGKADFIFDEKDIRQSGLKNLYEFLFRNIPGLRMWGAGDGNGKRYLAVKLNGKYIYSHMNGRYMGTMSKQTKFGWISPEEEMSKYPLDSIRGIELVISQKYTKGQGPQLIVTTYTDIGGPRFINLGATTYKPWPVTKPKAFYSPKYSIQSPGPYRDYRPTIHWEPNIVTGADGKATVSFYTSDTSAGFSVNIQGASFDGYTGSVLYQLNSKKPMQANLLPPAN